MNQRDFEDNTRSFVPLTKGTMVSHYRIVEKIGAGGMGEVYLAEDTKLRRQVALKFYSSQILETSEAKTRFVNEARAAAALDHSNICAVYEIDEFNGRMFIAMAYIDGLSLKEKIQSGPLKLQEALKLSIEIAQGLQEAHNKNIIHRDIKSANVMANKKGQCKITDFGLAKLAGNSLLTRTGTTMGTAAYMSPEQVRGEAVDHRSDIWSYGIVLYEMLTGRLPFKGDSEHATTHQIVHEDVEPITAVRSGIPMELERIVNKCMTKDSAGRYQHVDDLLVDLRNIDKAPKHKKVNKRPSKFVFPLSIVATSAALLIVLVFLKFPGIDSSYNNPLMGATFTKITDIEGYDTAISPDGKFIAFVSDHDGTFDVWVSQVGTGNVYNRTRGQTGDVRAAGLRSVGFSGDGSEIWISGNPYRGMRIMPLLDGPLRNIFTENAICADWTSDGSHVVYRTSDPGDPVFVADSDGTNSREILGSEPGMHQHFPNWSIDDQWIYLVRGRENTGDVGLWRVSPDGEDLEQLTFGQTNIADPTPIDKRTVFYIAKDRKGTGPWLWAVDVETKKTKRVSIGLEEYTSVNSSADGRLLAVTVAHPEASLWSVPILDGLAEESDASPYSLPVVRALTPRFGGEMLYFLSSRGTGDGLWMYHNDKLVEIWSGSEAALLNAPAISSDGKSIAIVLKRNDTNLLHFMNSDGSNLRVASEEINVRGTASWSPGGERIVVGGRDASGLGLFIIPVNGDPPVRIVNSEALSPVWSPTGDLIVYAGRQVGAYSKLIAVRPDGTPLESFNGPEIFGSDRFRFLPNGSSLIYLKGPEGVMDFWMLNLSTNNHRPLTKLAHYAMIRTFDITPDGNKIVFDRLRENSEVVLIKLAKNET